MKTVLHIDGQPVTLEKLERKAGGVGFQLNGKDYRFRGHALADGFVLEEETAPGVWRCLKGANWKDGKGQGRIQLGALEAKISQAHGAASHAAPAGPLSPLSPMPGLVRQILVKAGDKVKKGDALAVIEAMKLQLTLSAGGDAVVEAVLVKEGEMVGEGVELVKLKG